MFEQLMQAEFRSATYFEHEVSTRNGDRRTIAWYNTVLQNENEEVLFTLSSGEDITERKVAEMQLQQAKEAAETATRAKSDFLAKMSHELRTPLNAIIGYSEMLMEDAEEVDQDSLGSDLDRIHTAGMHLLGLINDVLDLSKIEAGKIELYQETFKVTDLMAEVVDTIGPLAAKKANTLKVTCEDTVGSMRADMTKVRQTLLNLIGNACKFTQQGTITVSVHRNSEPGNDWIYFIIGDTGIGMTKNQMEKMYQAFTQAEASTSSRYGGTGLGLAISKQFCRLMGGDIEVESQIGKGTTFTISLPATGVAPEGGVKVASAPEPEPD